MHKKLIKEIVKRKDTLDMEELECVVVDLMDDIKLSDPEEYKHIEHKLYKIVYGNHMSEELAKKWVSRMENKDGTNGEHWTYEQTSQYAGNHDKWDWYAVMNMVYSDYYNQKFDTQTYIELAKDWINDKDVSEGKTLRYYFYVVC